MAKRQSRKQKKRAIPKWIVKTWKKPKYYTKNWLTFFNTIVFAFLCNAPLLYYYHKIIANTPVIKLIDYYIIVIILDSIWLIAIIWLNYYVIFPVIINKVNVFLYKIKPQGVGYLITSVFVFLCLYVFQAWNIDIIIASHKVKIAGIINKPWKHHNTDPFLSIDFSNVTFIEVSEELIRNSDYNSAYGRFIRTYRWHHYITLIEQQYNIEAHLLAGLIMQESYGNPLQLNSQNDGGAGLMMFQPGTAIAYGLKVYGSSTATGRDTRHGLSLRRLVESHQYNYNNLSILDERFDVVKSMNAGAKFLSELYQKHQSWDKAISAYNRGTPALAYQTTQHVRMVRYFQKQYQTHLNNHDIAVY